MAFHTEAAADGQAATAAITGTDGQKGEAAVGPPAAARASWPEAAQGRAGRDGRGPRPASAATRAADVHGDEGLRSTRHARRARHHQEARLFERPRLSQPEGRADR